VLVLVRHDVVIVGCPRVWVVAVRPAVAVSVTVLLGRKELAKVVIGVTARPPFRRVIIAVE
jgi:hypothetical protein